MNFKNANIYTENFEFKHGCFSVENGVFASVLGLEADDAVDLDGAYVVPGVIDVHTHGNSGHDFCDGDYDGLKTMAEYFAKCGVTSFSPSSLTVPYDVIEKAFVNARKLREEDPEGCAAVRGITMEGPFFSEKRKGAQNAAHLRLPDYDEFVRLNDFSGNLVRIACVAPELEGAMDYIKKVSKVCVVSIAHTDCDYDTAVEAIQNGATQLTHTFNAMNSIHHRKPGPIVAASENENVYAELIGDGMHIHPASVRLAFKIFGAERMIIVSDSLRCCGMPDGEIDLGGLRAFLSGGVAKLEDGTLAGSMTDAYECMRRVASFGVKREDAIRAATYNPAKQLGCLDKVGMIREGLQADFVICDENLNKKQVYLKGKLI